MKKKNIFAMRFAIVAIAIGVISPSGDVKSVTVAENSYIPTISLLNRAQAAPVHRQARRVSRRTSRRTTRRNVAYHGGGRYYGGGSYHRNTGAAVVGGMVVGATVATVANSSRRY